MANKNNAFRQGMFDKASDKLKLIIFISVLALVSYESIDAGVVFLFLEFVFIATLYLAVYCRKHKRWKQSIRMYLVNRAVGFLQPIITLFFALFVFDLEVADHGLAYSALIADVIITVITIDMFVDYFSPVRVREMLIQDVESLYEIEKETFSEDQLASPSQIKKRIQTNPGTCFLAEHVEFGVVGSLYVRPVSKEDTVVTKKDHKEIQNNDDFSTHKKSDSLYIVGIQAKKVKGVSVAAYLQAACIKNAMLKDYKGIFGGPRIPEYHLHKDVDLEQFVQSDSAKLLKHLLRNATIPFVCKPEVLCGLYDYFPDPESLNCAALVWMPTPFYRAPKPVRKIFSGIIYSFAIAF